MTWSPPSEPVTYLSDEEIAERIREKQLERAWKFIRAWEVVERELGRKPTMQEFAEWWQVSFDDAKQEKARFAEAFLEQSSPSRMLRDRNETWRWEGGAHDSGRSVSCVRCGVQVVVPADSIGEGVVEEPEGKAHGDAWHEAHRVLEETGLSSVSTKAIAMHVSGNGACHWCKTRLSESGVTYCKSCRALNLDWSGETLRERLPQVAFVWPLDDEVFRLADGRKIAYTMSGAQEGTPVFFFHGSPNSRLWHLGPETGLRGGIRLIAVDRPGFGGSDPLPGRTVGSWTDDLVQLADHLGLKFFNVIGWSAGGLYAAACAALIPERLAGVGIISTRDLATYDFAERAAALDELGDEHRRALELINRVGAEEATGLLLPEKDAMARRLLERPASILDDLETPEGDRWFWANATRRHPWLEAVRESVRQGPVGYVSDWVARLQPWGFRLADIDIPVDLWHGEQDPLIRRQTMDFAAEAIPRARLHVWPDAGHLGLAKHWTEVLQSATGIRERD